MFADQEVVLLVDPKPEKWKTRTTGAS